MFYRDVDQEHLLSFPTRRSSDLPVSGTFSRPSSSAVPAFPGATKTVRGLGPRDERRSFHASACSLPPPPITSSFISGSQDSNSNYTYLTAYPSSCYPCRACKVCKVCQPSSSDNEFASLN